MKTEMLTEKDAERAGEILRDGGLVAIPTETVYGLAANALDGEAVSNIFKAKGRPMDNPLIVHVAKKEDVAPLVKEIPPLAFKLMDRFWPGPLTIIMPKSDLIPDEVSAGLDTVAIRMPSHPVARKIIEASSVPLAAPSANTSGKPSPTTAEHVYEDLVGKINAIVDGGACDVGVESTVITLCSEIPRLLRPGKVTPEELASVLGPIKVDDAVLHPLKDGAVVMSPGMKYKHYSPTANVIVVSGTLSDFRNYVNEKVLENKGNIAALVFDGEETGLNCKTLSFGRKDSDTDHANRLFGALRKSDELGMDTVYVRCPSAEGVGLAVMNRLLRAAEFQVIEL